ncbi:MAG TPA: carboxypeptidase-like regulatory domain-containing protein [Anaerolineales bacterium]|nr:carboxypeptidase-like regulatory domain-containing protein [Anaerolineales bacterium]
MFEKDPSLKEFQDGLPDLPPAVEPGKQRMHRWIAILAVLVLFLGFLSIVNSQSGSQLVLGKGAVEGVVLTSSGEPFQGEVLVLGSDQSVRTNADGSFRLENVPAGEQSLIILDENGGNEIRVYISRGETYQLGVVRFVETAMP